MMSRNIFLWFGISGGSYPQEALRFSFAFSIYKVEVLSSFSLDQQLSGKDVLYNDVNPSLCPSLCVQGDGELRQQSHDDSEHRHRVRPHADASGERVRKHGHQHGVSEPGHRAAAERIRADLRSRADGILLRSGTHGRIHGCSSQDLRR